MSRSRHGVIDRVYRNGELVAERHRYDNRLTMAVLTRLDRQAEGLGEGAPVARAIAQEYDRFLDLLPQGVAGAEAFIAARFPNPAAGGEARAPQEPPACDGDTPATGAERALLARLRAYRDFGVGLPAEIDVATLDTDAMESWTGDQCARAEFSGLLDRIDACDWPESARDPGQDDTDGMCHLRKLYLRRYPKPAPAEDDFEGLTVWQGVDGEWLTDFPPPDGFDGWESGERGEEDYWRALTVAEQAALGIEAPEQEPEPAERLAADRAARDRYFGFDGNTGESEGGDGASVKAMTGEREGDKEQG